MSPVPEHPTRPRIGLLDTARGVALIAMASYHFAWDLEFFRYIEAGTTAFGWWKMYARGIAGSFLFLVGFSLVLAHTPAIRWRPFLIRLAMIAGAAVAITAATAYAMPDGMIFFGILHCIAAASLVGLLFLRLPPIVTLIAAAAALAAPWFLRTSLFDTPWLWWLGLSETIPRSNDYVPLLPWLGPVLIGIAAANIARTSGLLARLASGPHNNLLARIGRHSLAFYLIHQPVLLGLVYLASLIFPAPILAPEAYLNSCVASCQASQGESFCTAFCGCTLKMLTEEKLYEPLQSGAIHAAQDERIQTIAQQCTAGAQ